MNSGPPNSIRWVSSPSWVRWCDIPAASVLGTLVPIVFALGSAACIVAFFAVAARTPNEKSAAYSVLVVGTACLMFFGGGLILQLLIVPAYWRRRPTVSPLERAWAQWRIACAFHWGKKRALLALRQAVRAEDAAIRCVAPAHMRQKLEAHAGLPLMEPEIVRATRFSASGMVIGAALVIVGVFFAPVLVQPPGRQVLGCMACVICPIAFMWLTWRPIALGVTSGGVEGMSKRWTIEDSVLIVFPVGWRAVNAVIVGPEIHFAGRFRSVQDKELLALFTRWTTREPRLELRFPRESSSNSD